MHHLRRSFLKTSVLFGVYMTGHLSHLSLAYAKKDGFLDLTEELKMAALEGKQLAILFEQKGCFSCKQLHQNSLKNPSLKKFMQDSYRVIPLDILGSREVTDFNGKTYSEKEFSSQWQINFTPTLSFFPADPNLVFSKNGKEAEAFRLAGFWKLLHFETVLRFVKNGNYKKDILQ